MKKLLSVTTLFALLSSAFLHAADAGDTALRFYLVRHGQTYSNIKEMTIGGGGNAQLTAKGRYDAQSLGLGLKNVDFIAAYSSTLGRAYETAQNILVTRPMTIHKVANLKDISWGDAEGGRVHDLTEQFGHSGNDFGYYFGAYDDPNFQSQIHTENMYDFSERFESALLSIAKKHQGQSGNILTVAHSSIAFYLQKFRQDKPLSGLSNTSVSVLEYKNGQFTLLDFNNTDYLENGYALEKSLPALNMLVVINPLTILNDKKILEGTSDSDLSSAGIAASQQAYDAIKSANVGAAYVSSLGRAQQTAAIMLKASPATLTEVPALNEIFLGQWEAEKRSTVQKSYAESFDTLISPQKVADFISPAGGENGAIAAYRLSTALNDIGQKHAFSPNAVAVFTHPIVFSAFVKQSIPDYTYQAPEGLHIVTLQYKNEKFTVKSIQTYQENK